MKFRFHGLLACSLLFFAASAGAAEVRYEMNDASEFLADGWFQNGDAPPVFNAGRMTVTNTGSDEWILYNDAASPTRWWNYVSATKGWWLEARLQLIQGPDAAGCFDGGPGLWMHDGTNLVKFTFTQTQARISYPMVSAIDMDPTDAFHTYRIQNLGGSHIQVLVDGTLQLDVTLTNTGGGTEAITFGDLGGCGPSSAIWEYLAYDTAAPGTEADDTDGDGIAADVDVCADFADPDQLDTDADRLGDACDDCPMDPQNDADKDGLCGNVDICPNSLDNSDSNNNGICDSMECLGNGSFLPAQGPPCQGGPACQCFVGVDPVGGPFILPIAEGGAGSGSGGSSSGGASSGGTSSGATSAGGTSAGGTTLTGGGTHNTTTAAAGSSNIGSGAPANSPATNSSGTCNFSERNGTPNDAATLLALGAVGILITRRRR